MAQEWSLGLKKLTLESWRDRDEAMSYFNFDHADPDERNRSQLDKWASQVLTPQLSDHVPDKVRALYEVARGATLYAIFSYPLMSLASE